MLTSRVSLSDMTVIHVKEYHLVVTRTKTSETIYHRNITEEAPLDLSTFNLENYLEEVEQKMGFKLSSDLPYPGDGDIRVTIGFSPTPFNDVMLWSSRDFRLEMENKEGFDKWLAENYSPAGEDASNGEQWFLSKKPTEFMPTSLSKLKEQYGLTEKVRECTCGSGESWTTCSANSSYCG